MLRRKSRKATSPEDAKFRLPVRSSRRLTLAGPAQLLSKQPVSPIVMLEGNVLEKIKKGLSDRVKSPSKTGNKAVAKKAKSTPSPKKAKAVKASPKYVPSSHRSHRLANVKSSAKGSHSVRQELVSPKSNQPAKASPKAKKTPSPRKSRRTVKAKASPKRSSPKQQKSVSPKLSQTVKPSPKPKKEPRSTQRTANVKPSPKQSPPKQQKSPSPKSSPVSPAGTHRLRSGALVPSPKPLRQDQAETQTARKTVTASRKRSRSVSPASKKKPKTAASPVKQSKSPAGRKSEIETPLKAVGKRKRHMVSEDKDKLSPPKKKLLKSETRSAAKKSSKKVVEKSFTEVKRKTVIGSLAKSERKVIATSQQNSTPLKPKFENDVSNWSMSSIKRKLLASITPYRMKENYKTPVTANAHQIKSALLSAKKIDTSEKQKAHRQSVRFKLSGKADTVKELKQKSSCKRVCYRLLQYMLLLGLPAAIAVGSVLLYNGLV